MIVAIIPARGGSKRIPQKNIRKFCGAPIIKYSIDAARDSGVFDRIIVSTDCDKIAEVAINCGAEVPFRRPIELSDDHTPTAPVLTHAIQQLQQSGANLEFACGIYPTAPLLQSEHLGEGLRMIKATGAKVVIPVTSFDYPIYRGVGISDAGALELLWPQRLTTWEQHEVTRSNDLPEAFHDVGQFYWLRVDAFLRDGRLWGPDTRALVIPRKFVVDIDTPEDWEIAELKRSALYPTA